MTLAEKTKLIEFLKEEGLLRGDSLIGPGDFVHGPCCHCTDCGHWHDECVCTHNRILKFIEESFTINE